MGKDSPKVSWIVHVASDSATVARNAANRILDADFAQVVMILVTTAAAVTYGWVEGYVINATLGNQQLLPYVLFGHWTMYQVAVGTLLGLITGGFALIKARSMFAKGNRYFLFACVGNWPFSWLIEDFTYFLFNPLDALFAGHWSAWILGGVYVYSPWLPGHPKPMYFVPTWYFLVFAWFLGCQWYAHRCTVYDNLLKDEIGQQILPKQLLAPAPKPKRHWPNLFRKFTPKPDVNAPASPTTVPTPVPAPQPTPKKETPVDQAIARRDRTLAKQTPQTMEFPPKPKQKPKVRSEDAEAALERLRKRWLKSDDQARTGE